MIKSLAQALIFVLTLLGSVSQSAYAQFSFEIPDRTSENRRTFSLDAITVGVSGKLALCSHSDRGTIILDVKGGKAPYTFRWNTLQTTKDRTNLFAGTYTVDITDAEGRKHTERIVVQPPFPLIINPVEKRDVSCSSDANGYAKISVKVGRGDGYTNQWSNGLVNVWETDQLKAGVYSVTVYDKFNCDITIAFEIKSALEGLQVTDQVQSPTCSGQPDGKINLNVSGGQAPYTFKWTSGATTKDLNGISAGDYQVQITDQKGCTYQKSFKVEAPISISMTGTLTESSCVGNTDGAITLAVSGGKAPYTFAWTTGASSKDISNLAAGNYSVRVTDASGCFVDKQFQIGTRSSLEVNLLESSNASCAGNADGKIRLGVKGAFGKYSVSWSDGGAADLNRTDLKAGTYQITVTDESGCGVTKTVELSEAQAITAKIESMLDVNCEVGSIEGLAWVSIQGGKEPYTITWNTGEKDLREIKFTQSGIIKVQVRDAAGCTIQTEARVDFPSQVSQGGRIDFNYRKLEINSEEEVRVSEDILFESVISTDFIAWEWEFGDGKVSQDKDPIHQFEKSGTFDVVLKAYDAFGCASQESKTIQVSNPTELVIVPNAFSPNGDGLNDTFIPIIKAVGSFSMEVFNTWGERMFFTVDPESKGWDGTFKGQILPAGNYLYRITYTTIDGRQFEKTGGITLIR